MQEDSEDRVLSNSEAKQNVGLTPGSMLGDSYQIVSLIGRGGMGTVYRVHQVLLGKDFALKVLDLHQRSDVALRRFHQEARTASQLQHANLVEVHDFGMFADDQPYLIMDFVEGQTLSQVLKSKGALPVDYVVNLAIQICLGLKYAHEKGVVHRDIKPANIMLVHPDSEVTEGTVKIVDFGIAKLIETEAGEIQTLTKTGEIFGSPIYMSPEQCRGTTVDRRSDIYSLGCVMFECLTGSPPFFGDSAMSTMLKRLSEPPVSLKEGSLGREFPQALENIVRKMLALEPDDRYQELGKVAEDLIALKRPDDNATVTMPFTEKAPKNDYSTSKQGWLLAGVAVASITSTALFDAFVTWPEKLTEEKLAYQEKQKKEQLAKQAEILLEKQVLVKTSDAAAVDVSRKFRFGEDTSVPYIQNDVDSSGRKVQFLVLPKSFGDIGFNDRALIHRARGPIHLSPNTRLSFYLNQREGQRANTLENLTELKFDKIDYCSNFLVHDDTIAILEKIDDLLLVGLTACDISNLKPFYKSKSLLGLELRDTSIGPSELLKIERIGQLSYLTIGPINDATLLLDEFGKTGKMLNLSLKGPNAKHDNSRSEVSPQFESLSKLKNIQALTLDSWPGFNDACLRKLLGMQQLKILVIRDCPITAASIPTLRKFSHLKCLSISTESWSKADLSELKKLPMALDLLTASEEREREGRDFIEEAGLIDGNMRPVNKR